MLDSDGLSLFLDDTAAMQSEHDHCRPWRNAGDLLGSLQAIHVWHLPVEDDDVGIQLFDSFDSDLAVFCLAAYL